jgi:hypothetical protein
MSGIIGAGQPSISGDGQTMNASNAVRRFFAYILMAVGGLITVLCGGCMALFLVVAIAQGVNSGFSAFSSMGSAALIIGGLPTAVGVVLFVIGRRMEQQAHASPPS